MSKKRIEKFMSESYAQLTNAYCEAEDGSQLEEELDDVLVRLWNLIQKFNNNEVDNASPRV